MTDPASTIPLDTPIFQSARDKIERARHHFGDLKTELAEYKSRNPFNLVDVTEGDSVEVQVVVKEEIPKALTLILGDCVHNLRSALDHIVFESVARPGTRNCDFPIWNGKSSDFSQTKWTAFVEDKVQGRNAVVLRRYLGALRAFQQGADEYLWVLHRLDIIDKHRLLLAVCAATDSIKTVTCVHGVRVNADGTTEAIPNVGELELVFVPEKRFPLDDGTVLLTLEKEQWADLKSMTPRLSIALAEPEPLAGHELEPAIRELIERVDSFVDNAELFVQNSENLALQQLSESSPKV